MGVNQVRGEGVCFTNLQEIWQATRFVKLLEREEYEAAARMLDFSEDYRELHEAEAMLDETYYDNSVFVETPTGGWAVSSEFAQSQGMFEAEDESDRYDDLYFWYGVMYNTPNAVAIPAAVWEKLVEDAYETEWGSEGLGLVPRRVMGEIWEEGNAYRRVATAWGDYYVEVSIANQLERDGTVSAAELVRYSGIVTAEVYEAAKETILAENAANKKTFYEYYGEELMLSEDDYIEKKIEDFITRMKAYREAGYQLEYRGMGDAFRVLDYWQIELLVTENDNHHGTMLLFATGNHLGSFVGGKTELSEEYLGLVEWLN